MEKTADHCSVHCKHTFPFFTPTPRLFLGSSPRDIREHWGTVDADVIKVWFLQEVFLTLQKNTMKKDPRDQKLKYTMLLPKSMHMTTENTQQRTNWLEEYCLAIKQRFTEDAFFFFPLWPDFDLVFFCLGFFLMSFVVLLFFLTPGPEKSRPHKHKFSARVVVLKTSLKTTFQRPCIRLKHSFTQPYST